MPTVHRSTAVTIPVNLYYEELKFKDIAAFPLMESFQVHVAGNLNVYISSKDAIIRCSFSNVIYHKFSHDASSYMRNGKNVIIY